MEIFHSIYLGIKRRPLRFLAWIFFSYSALWTIIESVSSFFPEATPKGPKYYLPLLILCLILACIRAYQRKIIEFEVKHANTKIRVFFGDIFKNNGYIAIPVNEFFDSEIGLPVSPRSLHGMVIQGFFGGHSASFDELISADLVETPSQIIQRSFGKTKQYKVGTTAHIKTNTHNFLLFALCVTDITTCKASANLQDLVCAIQGLCKKSRVNLGGEKLVVPLAGSGLSGIGLPAQHLLHILLLTLIDETKRNQFALEIDIVLNPSRFDEIDLSIIENIWR